MLASGDWVVPSFNGEPRLHKPVLIYWLMSASFALFGDSPLATRLPSILASALSGVLLYNLTKRWWGRRTANWATLIWTTAPLTIVESRMATTDAVLNLLTLGMLACVAGLYQSPNRWLARLFWLLAGLSILTKGPVGLLPLVFAIAGARYWSKVKFPMAHLRPVEGAIISLAVVLPWLVAATVRTNGDFLRFAVGRELLGRTVAPAEGHWGVPGYYLGMMALLMCPWACFLPMAVKRAWQEKATDPRIGFLLGWAFGPLIILELLATKLVHYHYSSYAALAMLIGHEMVQLEKVTLRPGFMAGGRFLRGSLTAVFALAAMLFLGLAWAGVWSVAIPSFIVTVVLGGTLVKLLPALHQGQWARGLQVASIGWLAAVFFMLAWLLPGGDRHRLASRVSSALSSHSQRLGVPVALGEFREPSVIYDIHAPLSIAISRSVSQTRKIVAANGAVLMPLTEAEIKLVNTADDVILQKVEKIRALDWDRGRRDSLTVCLLTRRPEERLAELPGRSSLVPNRRTPDPVKRY
jgi:4-amino-4-deoxy-L-arabinose transferase-like glycosyltransferase